MDDALGSRSFNPCIKERNYKSSKKTLTTDILDRVVYQQVSGVKIVVRWWWRRRRCRLRIGDNIIIFNRF
jgi:hypothetical protein